MKQLLTAHLREIAAEDAAARADDAAWIRRAAGRSTRDEEAALLARAADDPEAALLAHATAPLSAEREATLFAMLDAGPERASLGQPSNVVPSRGRAPVRAALVWGAPAMAAAAAIVLALRARAPEVEALPEYAVAVEGADAQRRSGSGTADGEERRPISQGARVAVVVRPHEPVKTAIVAAAFVRTRDGARAMRAPGISASGTVSLEGTREELFGDLRGDVDVIVWIGAEGAIPRDFGAATEGEPNGAAARRVIVPLVLR